MERSIGSFGMSVSQTGKPFVADRLVETFHAEIRFRSHGGTNALRHVADFRKEHFLRKWIGERVFEFGAIDGAKGFDFQHAVQETKIINGRIPDAGGLASFVRAD